jgi:tRNA threonylcarbamoyladenosine biosynthesis protein TsaB
MPFSPVLPVRPSPVLPVNVSAEYNIEPVGLRRMIVLALDTTSRAGSAAVVSDGELLAHMTGDPAKTHGERLPGDLERILQAAGLDIEDVDLLAVCTGPGSFTGLRVGIAAVQGLAVALARPVVPVSAFEALVAAGVRGDSLVAPWIDAQRGEVFAAVYDAAGGALAGPTSLAPAPTLTLALQTAAGRPLRFLGDGALRYREIIARVERDTLIVDPAVPALAPVVARIAAADPGRGVRPHAVVPVYVRRPDAELARERRASGG